MEIYLVSSFEIPYWEDNESKNLTIGISQYEWSDLFIELLEGIDYKQIITSDEDAEIYSQTLADSFQNLRKKLPMLGKIEDYYQDTFLSRKEIDELLQECESLKNDVKNPKAISFLEKLIFACKEAVKINKGIILIAD